jgi:hypothetical protein
MHTTHLLLMTIIACLGIRVIANSPNWLGTFSIDDSCDQNECCCVTEQATITKASDSQLLISTNVAGVPCQEQLNGSTTIAVLMPIPKDKSGFQITTRFLGTYNRFTLNDDSQSIANVNLQYPRCSGIGRRVSSNWLGTFIVDNSCDQSQCCCLVDQVRISKVSDLQLLVAANVAGTTCPQTKNISTAVEIPIPLPQDKYGFQLTTFFVGSYNRFTLTYDSQFIANANLQFPQCSGTAQRISSEFNSRLIRANE